MTSPLFVVHFGFEGSFTAWFIGTFSALITAEGQENLKAKNDAVTKALIFCHHFNVPEDLQRAIVSHTKYHYHSNYVVSQGEDVMSCLPHYLRNELKDLLVKRSYDFLKQIDLFRGLHDRVIGELALSMESVACNGTSQFLFLFFYRTLYIPKYLDLRLFCLQR